MNFHWENPQHLVITGVIDEDADFTSIFSRFPEEIWIDFSGISRINSCGVREWIKAVRYCSSIIHFVNCSPIIVDQLAMIPQFLGMHGIVDSFFANFICTHCSSEQQMCVTVGKEINLIREDSLAIVAKCPQCQNPLEMDQSPEILIDFLNKSRREEA